MPQNPPFHRAPWFRLATERPFARRSLMAVAGLFGAGTLGGCGLGRSTAPVAVERIIRGNDPVSFTMHYTVGKDFLQAHHLIEEAVDRVKLTVEVTTGSSGSVEAVGIGKAYDFTLARPLGGRRFVDHDDRAIPLS
ncbi:hypothetical protein ACTQ49_02085 [Luteococcus sp. Sow4_B9]|uniref:hypothetical protein n=1 Tax=Luteococcus sp. Sow4_B9 TaxID=3438792 RepID=UPI003F9D4052